MLDRLTFLGRSGALAAIMAGLLVSFLLFGYFVVHCRFADMDLVLIHDALAMNEGHPAHYVDHPAYLIILTLKSQFVLLHHLHLLHEWTLSAIPKDAAGFDLAGQRCHGALWP